LGALRNPTGPFRFQFRRVFHWRRAAARLALFRCPLPLHTCAVSSNLATYTITPPHSCEERDCSHPRCNSDEERENAQPSASATPMKTRPELTHRKRGMRSAPKRHCRKSVRTPIAAATRADRARPAPIIYLLRIHLHSVIDEGRPICCSNIYSVARMNCVVMR